MQRSKEQHKANRSQPKIPASKGKPQQAKAADAALAEFAGEEVASILPQTSSLITRHRGNVPYDPTQAMAHPLQSPSGPCAVRR